MNEILDRARQAASSFAVYGDFAGIEAYGTGHINATFRFTMDQGGRTVRYLLQRINTSIFRDPEGLMDNVVRVTEHLRRRLAAEGRTELSRRALTVVPTREGRPLWRDEAGGAWRCYLFIEKASASDLMNSPEKARYLGEASGRFLCLLSDMPGPRLVESIPNFHNPRLRYAAFEKALSGDPRGRASSVRPEIAFMRENREGFDRILAALESGAVPERTTHNDTKISNLLLDDATAEAICMIDLDTVMPGSSAYDFGDLARTVPTSAAEDDPDNSSMSLVMPMYEALAQGFARGTADKGRSFLTPAERELLPWGARIVTLLMAIRFLTDYLCGDVYYHVARESHNLDRCRSQIALIRSMDARWTEVLSVTKAAFAGM